MAICGKKVGETMTTQGQSSHSCTNEEGHWWPCGMTRPNTVMVLMDSCDGVLSMTLLNDNRHHHNKPIEVSSDLYEEQLAMWAKARAWYMKLVPLDNQYHETNAHSWDEYYDCKVCSPNGRPKY